MDAAVIKELKKEVLKLEKKVEKQQTRINSLSGKLLALTNKINNGKSGAEFSNSQLRAIESIIIKMQP